MKNPFRQYAESMPRDLKDFAEIGYPAAYGDMADAVTAAIGDANGPEVVHALMHNLARVLVERMMQQPEHDPADARKAFQELPALYDEYCEAVDYLNELANNEMGEEERMTARS
jgi:hypothetical protein